MEYFLIALTAVHLISFLVYFMMFRWARHALNSRNYLFNETKKTSVTRRHVSRLLLLYVITLVIISGISYPLMISYLQ